MIVLCRTKVFFKLCGVFGGKRVVSPINLLCCWANSPSLLGAYCEERQLCVADLARVSCWPSSSPVGDQSAFYCVKLPCRVYLGHGPLSPTDSSHSDSFLCPIIVFLFFWEWVVLLCLFLNWKIIFHTMHSDHFPLPHLLLGPPYLPTCLISLFRKQTGKNKPKKLSIKPE